MLFLQGLLQSGGAQPFLCIFPTPTPLDNQDFDLLKYKNIGRTIELETIESQQALISNTQSRGNRAKRNKLTP